MNENKTNNKPLDWIVTAVTALVGVIAVLVILGLATQGLSSYLKDMNDTVRTGASIIGVALLAYAVSALVVRFARYLSK